MARRHPRSPRPEHRPPPWGGASACVKLWHGTTDGNLDRLLTEILPTAGERNRDFGRGFYTTTYEAQARIWAKIGVKRLLAERPEAAPRGCVIWFRVPVVRLAPLHSLAFVRPEPNNHDFWSFVCDCREFDRGPLPDGERYSHRYPHPGGGWMYDMVSGPVAATYSRKGRPVFGRQVFAEYDQFSFHTPTAAAIFNELLQGVDGQDYGCETFVVR